MKKIIKILIYYLFLLVPTTNKTKIFTTLFDTSNSSGPGRFLYNLDYYFKQHGTGLERFFLRRARSVLIFSLAPFENFYNLCSKNNIKTVLRVDGFFVPTVFDNREYDYRSSRKLDFDKMKVNHGMQLGLLKSDWVIYQSKFSKEMIDHYLYNRIKDYSIIYNGVNTEHFKPINQIPNKIPVVMMLGNWRDEDILLCSLNAFKCFCERQKAILKVFGELDGKFKDVVFSWVAENINLEKNITFMGHISYENLPYEISKCDVSLHLKSGDWCPNAVLETLACGVPVVCQSYGGTKELVGDAGKSIKYERFLYDETLSQKAANSMQEIIKNSTAYQKLARDVALKFSLEYQAKKYYELLK
jgi:glycosyltransferase involved in cell wall biosynthesis